MKKVLILLVCGIFTLSSFGLKTTESKCDKSVKRMKYYFHCRDGHMSGSFICDGGMEEAQAIANSLC